MRICIDATSLLLRSAGVKNYIYHWMHALSREGRGHSISAFPMLGRIGGLDHESSVLSLRQTLPRIAMLHALNVSFNRAIDLLMRGIDVFHASNQVRNPPRNVLLTATIYDVTYLLMPQHHTRANVRAESTFAARILSRAAGMIAISENTRADAVRLLRIDPERIRVIYPGIAASFFEASPSEEVKAKYRLGKPYILFVGTVEPRKNVDLLLDACAQLPEDVRDAYDLVIAGPAGWAQEHTIARLRSGIRGIRYLGYVPEADLPSLTAGATVFAYPSLYEGFGFPPAQAMAAGVPVVTSTVSCLPEVAGPGALLADPESVHEVKTALFQLLTSPDLQHRLGQAGRERALQYTWGNAARQSIDFFEKLR